MPTVPTNAHGDVDERIPRREKECALFILISSNFN